MTGSQHRPPGSRLGACQPIPTSSIPSVPTTGESRSYPKGFATAQGLSGCNEALTKSPAEPKFCMWQIRFSAPRDSSEGSFESSFMTLAFFFYWAPAYTVNYVLALLMVVGAAATPAVADGAFVGFVAVVVVVVVASDMWRARHT
mmetsp:Transcript_110101/g.187457  ORF Transcript_110101/g.187457 Transcript_110101/m.187457 type:complete len:145 (-) Transcript_110101:221-655(-)